MPFFFIHRSYLQAIKYTKRGIIIWIVLCAFSLGLLTLIRPTDIIAIVIPITLGMTSLQKRWEEIKSRIPQLLKYGLPAFLLAYHTPIPLLEKNDRKIFVLQL